MLTTATIERILAQLSGPRRSESSATSSWTVTSILTHPHRAIHRDGCGRVSGDCAVLLFYPGAAGTVINNLAALGVGAILPIAVLGDDGEGYDLRQALAQLPAVDPCWLSCLLRPPHADLYEADAASGRPACAGAEPPGHQEPLAAASGSQRTRILDAIEEVWPSVDGAAGARPGAPTRLRRGDQPRCLASRCAAPGGDPGKMILVDSRERLGLFRAVWLKPNETECLRACAGRDCRGGSVLACPAYRPPGVLHPRRARHPGGGAGRPDDYALRPGLSCHWSDRHVSAPATARGAGIACGVASGVSILEAAAVREPGGVDHDSTNRRDWDCDTGPSPHAVDGSLHGGAGMKPLPAAPPH